MRSDSSSTAPNSTRSTRPSRSHIRAVDSADGYYLVSMPTGQVLSFHDTDLSGDKGVFDTLVDNGGTFTLTQPDGTKYDFDGTSGRLNDITRVTPQTGGTLSFAGTDSRLNNITIDGSYFNNSFGLRNSPGDTSGVAPISLAAIEQVQVNVAPFDVRQGNFVGAGVNTVTRSGTNMLRALWGLRHALHLSWRRAIYALTLWFGLTWVVTLACIQAIVQRSGVFLRTPKSHTRAAWQRALKKNAPELRVRFNYPYKGSSDGLATFLAITIILA